MAPGPPGRPAPQSPLGAGPREGARSCFLLPGCGGGTWEVGGRVGGRGESLQIREGTGVRSQESGPEVRSVKGETEDRAGTAGA